MGAVFKREFQSYFTNMIGYIFIAVLIIFIGIYFMAFNLFQGSPYYAYTLPSVMTIMMFTIPILTMKSIAEDRRSKTDQLLLTAPISLTKVVFGKFLAMIAVLAIPLLVSCICPVIIKLNGTAHLLNDYACILVLYLAGCLYVSIGMFISSLTESQIIAAVGTFAALLILFLWPDLVSFMPAKLSGILGVFNFRGVFYNFVRYHTFDTAGLVLYISWTLVFIFLTIQQLQKRRWN